MCGEQRTTQLRGGQGQPLHYRMDQCDTSPPLNAHTRVHDSPSRRSTEAQHSTHAEVGWMHTRNTSFAHQSKAMVFPPFLRPSFASKNVSLFSCVALLSPNQIEFPITRSNYCVGFGVMWNTRMPRNVLISSTCKSTVEVFRGSTSTSNRKKHTTLYQ